MRPSVRAGVGSLLAVTGLLVAAAPAHANGRAPQSVKVVFRPGATNDLLLGVTFGLMVSHDNAATWRWICESAVGFQGTFDPDYEISASGAIWATTYDGLRVTRDGGCDWQSPPAPLGAWAVTEVTIAPDGAIYAGAADPVLGSTIFKSTDDGASFQATGDLNQVFDWFDTIEVAPSDPQRVYMTGYRLEAGLPRKKLLFRSMNGGGAWESLPTTAFLGTDLSDVQVVAVDPHDPEEVYVKVTFTGAGLAEAIYRTTTWSRPLAMGGPTWTKVLDLAAFINAVVVRDNGEVWVTTTTAGTHRSTDNGLTFSPVPGLTYEGSCLVERPGDHTLWMCANHLPPDLMALGSSPDGAAGTWTVKLQYSEMKGPVSCPAGNNQHDDCEVNLWCGTREQFGVTGSEIDCTDAGEPQPPMPEPKPCCGAGGGPPGLEIGLAALALLLRGRRRQRRGTGEVG